MKKTTLLLNLFLLLSVITFSQTLPSVSITVDKDIISENGGTSIVTASVSDAASKAIIIPLTITGTANLDLDYSTDFPSKGYSTVAGGNGEGLANNQFAYPNSIQMDSSNNLYVADPNNRRVMKWTPGATEGIVVAGGNGDGSANNQLSNPNWIYIDSSDNLYVTDKSNHRIMKWTPGATEGIVVAGGNGDGSANNQFSNPRGIYLDSSNNLYVADTDNNRVMKWASGATEGVIIAGGNGEGSANNQFNSPRTVLVDASNNLYISDAWNDRVMKWTLGATEGILVAGGNGRGSSNNQLSNPSSIHLDVSNNLYIVDGDNRRVMKWTSGATEGTLVFGGNGAGSASNQLEAPTGLYVDASENIYVADTYNHRIQKKQISPQIVISKGSKTGTFTITGIEDMVYDETDETIIVTPSNAINGTLVSADPKTIIIENHNNAPTANAQSSVSATEQTLKEITLTGSDVENDNLTYIITSLPNNGTLTDLNNNDNVVSVGDILASSTINYTSTSDTATSDNFTFKVNDGELDSNIADIDISITPVNDIPKLENSAITTDEDIGIDITLNAVDPDDTQISYNVASTPSNGIVVIVNNFATYRPSENFNGTDSFTVTAYDGEDTSNPATISIIVNPVNDAPVANSDIILVDEGEAITTLQNGETNLLTNDIDIENSSLIAIIVTEPSNGTLTLNSDGTFSYQHNGSETITDSFTYKANDGEVDSNITTVAISVNPVNDSSPSEITLSNNSTSENLLQTLVGQFTVSDIDLPNDSHTFELINGTGDDDNSSFTIRNNELYTAIALDYETKQALSIRIKVSDENNQSFEKPFTIDVININDINITSQVLDSYCSGSLGSGSISITEMNQTFGATTFMWTASNGGIVPPNQENSQNLTNLTNGTYNLALSDEDFTYQESFTVNLFPQYDDLSICYVSSDDSKKTNNRIYLNNQGNYNVAFYEILRESNIANVYTTVGTITSSENSFLDETSNNSSQSYNYKVRLIDNCGNTSSSSDLHKTILLQSSIAVNNSVNLNWSNYIGTDFSSYNIYRSTNENDYELISSVSSNNNSYNDIAADVVSNNYEYYISIETDNCLTDSQAKSSSEIKSNFQNVGNSLSSNNTFKLNKLTLYPNPVKDNLSIKLSSNVKFFKAEIYNVIGQKVLNVKTQKFSTKKLSNATYFIKVFTSQGIAIKHFLKE